jgi:hypothetical protein
MIKHVGVDVQYVVNGVSQSAYIGWYIFIVRTYKI